MSQPREIGIYCFVDGLYAQRVIDSFHTRSRTVVDLVRLVLCPARLYLELATLGVSRFPMYGRRVRRLWCSPRRSAESCPDLAHPQIRTAGERRRGGPAAVKGSEDLSVPAKDANQCPTSRRLIEF